jgi:hypothetical protein
MGIMQTIEIEQPIAGIENPCICPVDGHCMRWNRRMSGKAKEICQGVNVSPEFRKVYLANWKRLANQKKVIFKTFLSPGDLLTLTCAIESLHMQYPGGYITGVVAGIMDVFANNPHVKPLCEFEQDVKVIDVHYNSINVSNQTSAQFIRGYVEHIANELDIPLTLQVNRPYIYLTDDEIAMYANRPKYCIVNAGIKNCYTCKQWPVEYYQEVINRTPEITWIQVGHSDHLHTRLSGVTDLVGKTNLRQLFSLVYNSAGAIGPVTLLMHTAAAFNKQYICLSGGREPVTWIQYPKQQTLHTIGMLDCCRDNACWKSRVVKLEDNEKKLNECLCENPVVGGIMPYPKCMEMITPDDVISIIHKSNW